MENDFKISVLAVSTQMISATGSAQNKAERPRTSRPSERISSSALNTGSDITGFGGPQPVSDGGLDRSAVR